MSVYKGTMGDDHASWAEYINVEGLHGCMKDGYRKKNGCERYRRCAWSLRNGWVMGAHCPLSMAAIMTRMVHTAFTTTNGTKEKLLQSMPMISFLYCVSI